MSPFVSACVSSSLCLFLGSFTKAVCTVLIIMPSGKVSMNDKLGW